MNNSGNHILVKYLSANKCSKMVVLYDEGERQNKIIFKVYLKDNSKLCVVPNNRKDTSINKLDPRFSLRLAKCY